MAATSCGRQAWQQLLRNSSSSSSARRSAVTSSSLVCQPQQRQQHQLAAALRRQASTSPRVPSRRAATQSPFAFPRQQPLAQRSYSSGSQGGQHTPPPPPPPRRSSSNDQIKFWPFLVVIALGSGGYVLLVKQRNGECWAKAKSTKKGGGQPPEGSVIWRCHANLSPASRAHVV